MFLATHQQGKPRWILDFLQCVFGDGFCYFLYIIASMFMNAPTRVMGTMLEDALDGWFKVMATLAVYWGA